MNVVKVSRIGLLTRLEQNRSRHRELFLKAQEGYRKLVIEELDKALCDAREGRAIRTVVALQAPEDHTEDYDTVIEMLQMSVEPEVTISSHDFQCYVMDKWAWSAMTHLVNSTYAVGERP